MKNTKKHHLILIVDDEISICNLLKKILSDNGFEIMTVQNGEAALAILKDTVPDLLMVDLKMPFMDGLELLRQARVMYPELKSILLTAYGTASSAREALSLGVREFLTKPFDNNVIKKVVREVLRAKE